MKIETTLDKKSRIIIKTVNGTINIDEIFESCPESKNPRITSILLDLTSASFGDKFNSDKFYDTLMYSGRNLSQTEKFKKYKIGVIAKPESETLHFSTGFINEINKTSLKNIYIFDNLKDAKEWIKNDYS